MFCIFLVWWRRSNIVWREKIFSFRRDNFWKFIIFDLHWQYVYEMKAENILKSNLQSKSIICYIFFCKNWILKNFRNFFLKFFFSKKARKWISYGPWWCFRSFMAKKPKSPEIPLKFPPVPGIFHGSDVPLKTLSTTKDSFV